MYVLVWVDLQDIPTHLPMRLVSSDELNNFIVKVNVDKKSLAFLFIRICGATATDGFNHCITPNRIIDPKAKIHEQVAPK